MTLADFTARRLKLSAARLVVLSACTTGLPEVLRTSADEAWGLPAIFLLAGAPVVISTLWPVEDLSTALLLTLFYGFYLASPSCPLDALVAAQTRLRTASARDLDLEGLCRAVLAGTADVDAGRRAERWRRYCARRADEAVFAHPYYWAGFVLTGLGGETGSRGGVSDEPSESFHG